MRLVAGALLISVSALANDPMQFSPFMRLNASETSYLVKQDFEGTGYDNGETWTEAGTATIDEDSTAVVLAGSQSLRIDQSATIGTTLSPTYTFQDEIWVYAMFHAEALDLGAIRNLIGIRNTAGSTMCAVQLNTTGTLRIAMNTVAATVSTITTNTTYHIWVHYKKGSGANAIGDVAFSTDGVKPTSGNNFAQITDGNVTAQTKEVIFGVTTSTQTHVWDKIRVDDAVIGDNPP